MVVIHIERRRGSPHRIIGAARQSSHTLHTEQRERTVEEHGRNQPLEIEAASRLKNSSVSDASRGPEKTGSTRLRWASSQRRVTPDERRIGTRSGMSLWIDKTSPPIQRNDQPDDTTHGDFGNQGIVFQVSEKTIAYALPSPPAVRYHEPHTGRLRMDHPNAVMKAPGTVR